jgi:hypothetical protein
MIAARERVAVFAAVTGPPPGKIALFNEGKGYP